jgi:hypothetical protein
MHSGQMPPELPELATFIAFAIVADAERVRGKVLRLTRRAAVAKRLPFTL